MKKTEQGNEVLSNKTHCHELVLIQPPETKEQKKKKEY